MEILPNQIKSYLPSEIIYKIYKYVDNHNDTHIKRMKEIDDFLYYFMMQEIYYRNNSSADIHEMMEYYVKKNKNMRLYKDIFNKLKCCNCCSRHKHNVPQNMYDVWDSQDLSPIRVNTCMCPCRHIRRILCVVV